MPSEPADENRRLEDIFHQAWDLPTAGREAFLEQACAGDAALRAALDRLLSAGESARSEKAWQEPAIVLEARTASLPATLDRYRLLELIGAGGMGVVYKAVRADDTFHQTVAIKLVQLAANDPALASRFQAERRILAALDHPNIARVYDAGNTREGLPFLAMEFVDGLPITRYVAARKPSRTQLLELFRKVCSAVSCAHRNLIVHRDLKPSNILVTPAGEPKLLDFGIAKLLDGTAEPTRAGAMTPHYASPEQILGANITTASDIYSLGVLLYELLGGKTPYADDVTLLQLARAIEHEFPPPIPGIDPDLQNIVLMALRKEPGRRYASVDQFSEDLHRYLTGFPVLARPDTPAYRARKFIGRNRLPLAAGLLVAASLAAGVTATIREAHSANRRFEESRKFANQYLFEFHSAIEKLPGSTPARQLILKRSLEYLDSLARETGNSAALTWEIAAAYEQIANLQGQPNTPNLGDTQGALTSYRKALALRQPLALASPANPRLQMDLANLQLRLGYLLMFTGDLRQAEQYQRTAVASLSTLIASLPADPKLSLELRRSAMDGFAVFASLLGNPNMPNLGKTDEAIQLYRKVLSLNTQLAAEYPADLLIREELSGHYNQLGQINQALNNGPAAVEAFSQALAASRSLIQAEPLNTNFQRNFAINGRNLALAQARLLNDRQAASAAIRTSAATFEELAAKDPANIQAQLDLFDSLYAQGWVLDSSRAAESIRFYNLALNTFDTLRKTHPNIDPAKARTAYQLRADARTTLGDAAGAIRDAQTELAVDDALLKASPANAGAIRNQALASSQIAKAHELLAVKSANPAEWREARTWHQRSLDIYSRQQREGKLIPSYLPHLEAAAQSIARCDRALARP